jgi:hypothetical protein
MKSRVIDLLCRNFYRYFNILFALIIAAMYANALIFPNMGADAAYYLRVAECVADGAVPEHTLRILYPPIVFYMLMPVKMVLGNTVSYPLYLGIMFLMQVLSAYFIYRISRHYSKNLFVNIFISLLYLFLSIKLEGEYFFLEPFINFWGLLAVFVYLKYGRSNKTGLFFSGLIVMLSFLSKQFGLAYIALIFLMILVDNRSSARVLFKNVLIFTLGVISVFILYMIFFRLIYGVWYDFLYDGRLALYGEKDFSLTIKAVAKYLLIGPLLLLLTIPAIFRNILWSKNHLLAWLIFLVLTSYQFYLNQYEHYYILELPVIVLLGGMILKEIDLKSPLLVIGLILLSLVINELFLGRSTKNMILSTDETLSGEMVIAEEINSIIQPNTNVYIFGNVKYYYLCHLNSAIPEKYGYAYSNILTISNLAESINQAEYVIVDKVRLNKDQVLVDGKVQIDNFIKKNNLLLYRETNNFLIYSSPSN